MLRSKTSDLKASHDQQLCKNWVFKSVNYLDVIKVGYSKISKMFEVHPVQNFW